MAIVCPVDEKDDVIQKVSAVVNIGTSEGSFSGPTGGVAHVGGEWGTVSGYSHLSGTQKSRLASLLAQPVEPSKSSCGSIAVSVFALWVGSFVCWVVMVGCALATSLAPDNMVGLPKRQVLPIIVALVAIAWILYHVLLVWFVLRLYRNWKSKAESKYASALRVYEAAMHRWQPLYYCFRHDLVFNPETGETCQPEAVQRFIYTVPKNS